MKKLFFILVFAFAACGPSGKGRKSNKSKAYCEKVAEMKKTDLNLRSYKYTVCNFSGQSIRVKSPKLKSPATLQSQQCRGFDEDSFCIYDGCKDWPLEITDAKGESLGRGEYDIGNYVVMSRKRVSSCTDNEFSTVNEYSVSP